jgi:hypothetical protein
MTSKRRCLLGACFIALLSWATPAVAEPPEPALQGCWEVAIDTPALVPTIHVRLKLLVRDESLSGTMSKGRWQAALRSTAVRGKRVRFIVDSPRGEARFSGGLEGGALRGSVSGSRGTYSWQGRRCGR